MEVKEWWITGDVSLFQNADPRDVVCFDTETTGLDPLKDEILSLSVVRGDGKVLFSELIRPTVKKRWTKAQEINGITPSMVKDKRTIDEARDDIDAAFSKAKVIVGYNVEFDVPFLNVANITWNQNDAVIFDVMREYAYVANKYDKYTGTFKWQKLSQCARHYSYKFKEHDSLEDTKATLHCFFAMLSEEKCRADSMVPYLQVVEIGRKSREDREKREKERAAKEAELKAREVTADTNKPKKKSIFSRLFGKSK